ncbi:hypothetical protein PAPYR_4825 [Paratrimastix pyriformis]|uniref:Uncharacterized protein n=1 Tax=Paratrimastix pyriformis TaxID=342808 RepID=A0ABQ8URC6_9EUKA|nr:hypothetical protein PAPYR_4825 [Paratrimastix pyriformis]
MDRGEARVRFAVKQHEGRLRFREGSPEAPPASSSSLSPPRLMLLPGPQSRVLLAMVMRSRQMAAKSAGGGIPPEGEVGGAGLPHRLGCYLQSAGASKGGAGLELWAYLCSPTDERVGRSVRLQWLEGHLSHVLPTHVGADGTPAHPTTPLGRALAERLRAEGIREAKAALDRVFELANRGHRCQDYLATREGEAALPPPPADLGEALEVVLTYPIDVFLYHSENAQI